MLDLLTLVGSAILVLVVMKYFSQRKINLPPGPRGLPFIGNLFQIEDHTVHKTLTKWSEEFGDVFKIKVKYEFNKNEIPTLKEKVTKKTREISKIKVLGQNTIVLNNLETIWEALVTKSNTFAGRGPSFRWHVLVNHVDDISFTTFTPKWVHTKKVAMQSLKMYGDNLENLEVISLDLIDDMIKQLEEASVQSAVDVYPFIHTCTTGIITSILYGHKVDEGKVEGLLQMMDEGMKLIQPTSSGMVLDICPWLRFFPNKLYSDLLRVRAATDQWLATELKDRKAKRDPGNPQCVIDCLFDHQKQNKDKNSAITIKDGDINGINFNFMTAGVFTTLVTTYALLAVLVNKPEIQKRMAKDIKAELGNRAPRLTDRKTLVYIEAAIMEILRYSSILPLNLPHTTTEDTTVNGYDIPKNTEVIMNLWKLHHDPTHWDDPWEFRPDRFLDVDGTLVTADHPNRRRLLPFSAGRRVCPGETLAKNRLFLIVTSLIQKFEFLPVSPGEMPPHDCRDYEAWIGIKPRRYHLKLVTRI